MPDVQDLHFITTDSKEDSVVAVEQLSNVHGHIIALGRQRTASWELFKAVDRMDQTIVPPAGVSR